MDRENETSKRMGCALLGTRTLIPMNDKNRVCRNCAHYNSTRKDCECPLPVWVVLADDGCCFSPSEGEHKAWICDAFEACFWGNELGNE